MHLHRVDPDRLHRKGKSNCSLSSIVRSSSFTDWKSFCLLHEMYRKNEVAAISAVANRMEFTYSWNVFASLEKYAQFEAMAQPNTKNAKNIRLLNGLFSSCSVIP